VPVVCHHPPAIRASLEELSLPLTFKLRQEYERLYTTQVIKPGRIDEVYTGLRKIETGKARYKKVEARTHVPWFTIGIIHLLECDSNFACHLHNGDSLNHRTKNEPSGRPEKGQPPFTWEDSAVDALKYQGFDVWTDWSIAGTLYKLEAYNGFGSRNHGIESPYLWGGTTFYSKGKYIKDGIWSPVAVSAQIGAGPLLRTLTRKKIVQFPIHL
jgi:lysozyme family protein